MDTLDTAVEQLRMSVTGYHTAVRALATKVLPHERGTKSGAVVKVRGYVRTGLKAEVKTRVLKELSRGQQSESYGAAFQTGRDARRAIRSGDVLTMRITERARQRDEAIKVLLTSEPRSMIAETLAFNIASHQGYIDGASGLKPQLAQSKRFSDLVAGALFAGVPTTALSNEETGMSTSEEEAVVVPDEEVANDEIVDEPVPVDADAEVQRLSDRMVDEGMLL